MYCVECGSENPEEGRFCFKCGSPIYRKEGIETQNQISETVKAADTTLSMDRRPSGSTDELHVTDKLSSNPNSVCAEANSSVSCGSEIPLESQGSKPLTCPNCDLINPPGTFICDCGYNFDLKLLHAPGLIARVHPWLRYWARMFDYMLFGLIVGVMLTTFSSNASDKFYDSDTAQLVGIALMFVWVFVEAFLISKCWMTPGKWLFRIAVIPSAGGDITYSKALSRSLKVWWRGMGIGFPLATLFTSITAYSRLKRDSVTTWDRDEGFVVTHERLGGPRIILITMCFIVFLIIMGFSQSAYR